MTDHPIEPVIVDAECQRLLDEAGLSIRVGDWYINGYHRLVQVVGFHVYRYKQNRSEEEGVTLYVDAVTQGGRKESIKAVDYFKGRDSSRYYRLHTDPDTAYKEALEEIENPTDDEMAVNSQTTALTVSFGAEKMKAIAAEVEAKATRAMVLRLLVERKLQSLYAKHSWMEKQLKYTYRVIRLLETYLGIYEKIIVLRDGERAPADTPIVIRQLIIYMDEEVGSVGEREDDQKGIDFKNIEEFDRWLLQDAKNLNSVMPEIRGVVAMRPSRQNRTYSDNFIFNDQEKAKNDMIYLLIRNGDKLSRVWANMSMGNYDRLFPTSEEMQKLFDQMAQEEVSDEDALKIKEKELDWQQNAVLLEGLLDRTDVFQPLETPVSLFDPRSYEYGRLILVRDAEPSIAAVSGYMSYKEWHRKINASLKRGSRVLFAGLPWAKEEDRARYYYRLPWNQKQAPRSPAKGVYTVEEVLPPGQYESSDCLRFLYMPDEQVFVAETWEYKDRERRVSIYIHRNEWFILAYDLLDLDTVEYYINNRIERKNYLEILPVLYEIRDQRLKEREAEEPFVKLVASDLNCDEQLVWDAVKWWKFKVIDHRPVAQDDAKAWRMIRGRIKRVMRGEVDVP